MTSRRVGLLDRLVAGSRGRSVQADTSAVVRSILANLQRILNTRRGSAAAQMDLGLPAPHEMLQGVPATLSQAQADIRACILRYEPRLASVLVRYVPGEPGDIAVRFQIAAVLEADDGRRVPLAISTAIGRDGRVRLSD